MIGSGGFAEIYAARWINNRSIYAIKKFINNSKKEIDNEVHLMETVNFHFHPNIIRFCGVTKLEGETNYSLVLEYANGGTLGKYLRDNAKNFGWENQLKFAKGVASAVFCLHDNGIIHRDLHPNNILIHQHTIKLADFGCSHLQGSERYTETHGVVPYMDPKSFNIQYHLTKKSDIYSLGVIFWELTSRTSPFGFEEKEKKDHLSIMLIKLKILRGEREHPIPSTNSKFVELYQKCWQHEPDERPNINQVISELNDIKFENNSNVSTKLISEVTKELEYEDFGDNHSDCDLKHYNL